jgi:hypothetical protein
LRRRAIPSTVETDLRTERETIRTPDGRSHRWGLSCSSFGPSLARAVGINQVEVGVDKQVAARIKINEQ